MDAILTKIKLVLAVGIVLTVAVLLIHVAGLKAERAELAADRDRLAVELTAAREQAASVAKELKLNFQALTRREAEKAELADATESLRRELEEVYQNDTPCQTWAATPVPDPVYRRLRK